MPGCVLRAFGKDFDVNGYLKKSIFRPYTIHQKGNPLSPKAKKCVKTSGFGVIVSDAPGKNFKQQAIDATAFLMTYRTELRRLVRSAGLDGVVLDFGITLKTTPEKPVFQFLTLPTDLLQEAGKLKIGIEISLYP